MSNILDAGIYVDNIAFHTNPAFQTYLQNPSKASDSWTLSTPTPGEFASGSNLSCILALTGWDSLNSGARAIEFEITACDYDSIKITFIFEDPTTIFNELYGSLIVYNTADEKGLDLIYFFFNYLKIGLSGNSRRRN